MEIYKVNEKDVVVEIKTVNEGYVLSENEYIGIPECAIGYNYKTKEEPPLTREQIYNKHRIEALADLEDIEDNIKLGIASQLDYDKRQSEWVAYHEANNPYK